MHSYDLEGREKVFIGLAVISIIFAWLLNSGLSAIEYEPQWWLRIPSFAGIYSALYWLFDRHIWRWRLLKKLGIIKTPDLNGTWVGVIQSSYQGTTTEFTAIITQRWSKISIILETSESDSRSNAAILKVVDLPFPELIYTYSNEPKSKAPDTMNIHRGAAILEYKNFSLEGTYFTGRGRNTYGGIHLQKK